MLIKKIRKCRVGHRILFRSERIVLFRFFKERNILLLSFFEFLATYETKKIAAFFSALFLKECKECNVILQRT